MKFKITLKDPDGFSEGVRDCANETLGVFKLSSKVNGAAHEAQVEEINEFLSPWVEYNEYVTLEFDTEAKTARVVPISEM
jgi:hypothetical protein